MSHRRRRFVNARVWNTESDPESFPETSDQYGLAAEWLREKADFGVAFSGGGTRSAAATLGQLRGLKETGLLDKVRYVSAVSGGSWAATPFTYLPSDFNDTRFLGRAKNPADLTREDFTRAKRGSLAKAISDTVIADDFLVELAKLRGDETFSRAIGRLFLKPFKLGDTDRLFTFHADARDAVLAGNRRTDDNRYYLKEKDFHTVRHRRPYLVVTGTIHRHENTGYSRQKMQCEYTPLYTGVRRLFPRAGRAGAPIGGGYVESFAYDSKSPEGPWNGHRWRVDIGGNEHLFTLSDVIGSSGAAPTEILEKMRLHKIRLPNLGFPEFRHWPIHRIGDVREEDYAHGDGGHLEKLGIMPLLARSVKSIIVFVNTQTKFRPDAAKDPYAGSLEPLFRPVRDHDAGDNRTDFTRNIIFEDDGKFDAMIKALKDKKAKGRTLIHCDTYTVRPNAHYHITNRYRVNVCWVYNEAVSEWSRALRRQPKKIVDGLHRFPHYRTFFQNTPRIIDLTVEEVNALAHLSCWNVTVNEDMIRKHLDI